MQEIVILTDKIWKIEYFRPKLRGEGGRTRGLQTFFQMIYLESQCIFYIVSDITGSRPWEFQRFVCPAFNATDKKLIKIEEKLKRIE